MVNNKKLADDLLEVSFSLEDRADELRPKNELLIGRLGMPGLLGKPTTFEHEHAKPYDEGDPIPPAIRKHHGFKWMISQPGIREARDSLLQQMKKKKLAPLLVDISEVRFFVYVAAYGAFAFNDPEWKPTTFSIDDKRAAVEKAKSLQALVKDGIWRSDYWQSRTFEQLLSAFIGDLEEPAPRDYGGPTARERYILTSLSYGFQIFELGSAAAVARLTSSIGESYGFVLGLGSYERYARKARSM